MGGLGSGGVRSGYWGWGVPNSPQPPDPNSPTSPPQPNPPDFIPPNPNPPDPTPTYHRCVANLPHRHCCKRLSVAYAQILGHIRMSHPLCGESSKWRIFHAANPLATYKTMSTRKNGHIKGKLGTGANGYLGHLIGQMGTLGLIGIRGEWALRADGHQEK